MPSPPAQSSDASESPEGVVRASRVVAAPAAALFDLLARPVGHGVIDGSGTVRGVQPGTPERLSAGARFGMQMRWGLPYRILNQVVEFEEGQLIAWRHFAGHVWRWRLEAVDARHTRVTEEFDSRPSRYPVATRMLGWPRRNAAAIDASLDRLERWARDRR